MTIDAKHIRLSLLFAVVILLVALLSLAVPANQAGASGPQGRVHVETTSPPTCLSSSLTAPPRSPTCGEGQSFCKDVPEAIGQEGTVLKSGSGAAAINGSLDGIYACGPEPDTGSPGYGDLPFESSPNGFQCVELANRFLWVLWGLAPVASNGDDFAHTVASKYGYTLHENASNSTAKIPFLPGDIVSFTGNSADPDGHVAIVIQSDYAGSGTYNVTIEEENATGDARYGTEVVTISNWAMRQPNGQTDITPSNFVVWPTNFTGTSTAPISDPTGITGADGALWFTNSGNNSIGRITTSGQVTAYTGSGIDHPNDIILGANDQLWFTNNSNNSIGAITTSGAVRNYTGTGINHPNGIALGPDGAMWFTNTDGNSIGRISASGVVKTYTGSGIDVPSGITVADGALWFTNFGNNSIGQITTSGHVTNYSGPGIDDPADITLGSDGALWFTNWGNNSIGRITTSGKVSNYMGSGIDAPWGIAPGPDGALWFANEANNSIGSISTSGVVGNYTEGGIDFPTKVTLGADGALWFTNADNDTIGRFAFAS